jgi:hypothetical protein
MALLLADFPRAWVQQIGLRLRTGLLAGHGEGFEQVLAVNIMTKMSSWRSPRSMTW